MAAPISRRSILRAGAAATALLPSLGTATTAARAETRALGDGLTLTGPTQTVTFTADGRVQGIVTHFGGTPSAQVPLADQGGGIVLEDPATGVRYTPTPELTRTNDGAEQHGVVTDANVALVVHYTMLADGALQVGGAVRDLSGTDRVMDVVLALPVASAGGTWQASTVLDQTLDSSTHPQVQNELPLAAVVGDAAAWSLAYAIPPDNAVRFDMTGTSTSLQLRLKLGLSPHGRGDLQSRAPFSFVLDSVDPRWGLRSALHRYYERHASWFVVRAERFGFWQNLRPEGFRRYEPRFYAYHEGQGDAAWDVAAVARQDRWDVDQANGVYTLPYFIPGQREVQDLPALPATYEEAVAAVQANTDPWDHTMGAELMRDVMLNCGLYGPDDRYLMNIRNTPWGGNSVTFPLNTSPSLFSDTNDATIAKYVIQTYMPAVLESPFVDGFYLDSLGGWGAYFNHRHEHFGYATVPLTYDDNVLKPAIYNHVAETELVWELAPLLHQHGKLLWGNNTKLQVDPPLPSSSRHHVLPFMSFGLDVIGAEVTAIIARPVNAALYRALSGRKPAVFLATVAWAQASEEDADQLAKMSVLEDIFVSSSATGQSPYPHEEEYQDTYGQVLQVLAEAGWAVLTGVRTNDAEVLTERYGSRRHFTLVLYNTSGEAKDLTLGVDPDIVCWPQGGSTVVDLVTDDPLPSDVARRLLHERRFAMAPHQLSVLRIA